MTTVFDEARPPSDGGFTLVELLIVVAIMGLVLPGLSGALLLGWRTTDATVASLADSRNREVVPSLFARDVQSAVKVDTDAGSTTCMQSGDVLVVRMLWSETSAAGTIRNVAAAWVIVNSSVETRLERRFCDKQGSDYVVLSSVTAAHNLAAPPAAAATCRGSSGATIGCNSAMRVDLTVSDASGAVTATGRRRTT
jgi:prepilin-type N-terminal cleavage/methylation domain-containing protein